VLCLYKEKEKPGIFQLNYYLQRETMAILPSLTICGLPDVHQIIDSTYSYLISIMSVEDVLIRPRCIEPGKHLELFFEDMSDPSLGYGQYYAPNKKDIQKIINFGREILEEQKLSTEPIKVLLHCSAGRSRSPAAGYILLCDWYGAGKEIDAAKEIKRLVHNCIPNQYMIRLGDSLLERKGQIIANAIFTD
jgi:predicted protein tyrosine phosphatase